MRKRLVCAGVLSVLMLLAASPASAQFMCTTTPTDRTCTNSGNAAAAFGNVAPQPGQNPTANATTINSGTANGFSASANQGGNATATNSGNNSDGFSAQTFNGGNATATNSGTNTVGFGATTFGGGDATATNSGNNAGNFVAQTEVGGNATATNSGTNGGDLTAQTLGSGNATASNSGTNAGVIMAETHGGDATTTNSGSNGGDLAAVTFTNGNATVTNSGSNTGNIVAIVAFTGNASATNSGSNIGNIMSTVQFAGNATTVNSGTNAGQIVALTEGGGNATATNSGTVTAGVVAETTLGGNATATNSGRAGNIAAVALASGNATVINSGTSGSVAVEAALGNSTVINSGTINGLGFNAIEFGSGRATLTNIVGGRVIGPIAFDGGNNTVNFQGGNWLFTIGTAGPTTTFNTGGAPFVVLKMPGIDPMTMQPITINQVAVLDPTTFALADRSLTNFTGEISEMLQGRFDGMSTGAGGTVLGFAAAPSSQVADQAQAAFSGIPSVAMSYASNPRPVLGKAPAAGVPYYDTTVWASGFGGERKQRADGDILPTTDTAFGGAMGVDRALGGNLRLGAFVGAGASREAVELNVQTIDATYVFGGAYGRFDWISQFLDFSLYGGGITNKSSRQVANNLAQNGLETATASYGGWFISPEVIYGYRLPFNAITVTPRVRLRYVGAARRLQRDWLDAEFERRPTQYQRPRRARRGRALYRQRRVQRISQRWRDRA